MELTEQNFEKEVLGSDIPVLVDFWAPWCGPCKMIAPAIEEIEKEYKGKIKVGKLNIDDARSLATQYQVMSIPTVAIFKDGEMADKVIGVADKSKLKEKVDAYL